MGGCVLVEEGVEEQQVSSADAGACDKRDLAEPGSTFVGRDVLAQERLARSRRRLDDRPAGEAELDPFHDHTADGKLKALITPTGPSGCHVSISR